MRYIRRQVVLDVRDVLFLKYGRTTSNIWAYLRPNAPIENPDYCYNNSLPTYSDKFCLADSSFCL